MRLWANLRLALRALARNKLRTFLTTLGIVIGVAAVIALVGIGRGAQAVVEAQVASLGQNLILVQPAALSRGGVMGGWGSSSTLTLEDARAIARELPRVAAVSAEVTRFRQITYGAANTAARIQGQSPDFFRIRAWSAAAGELFTEADEQAGNKVGVIGQTTARTLFGEEDPVGKVVRVRGTPVTIRGVLAPKGYSFSGADQDDILYVPITTMMRRIATTQYVTAINVQAWTAEDVPRTAEEIAGLLRQRQKVRADQDDPFVLRTQQEIAAAATATSRTMTVLLAAIAGVSLVVGGIGIMNIMLVSVTERTREIGIRLAIGARGRDVRLQFVTESLFLSTLGGTLGIILGWAVSLLLARQNGWPVLVATDSILLAVGVSAAIGVFFGWFPAQKAAQLDPIEALRYE